MDRVAAMHPCVSGKILVIHKRSLRTMYKNIVVAQVNSKLENKLTTLINLELFI